MPDINNKSKLSIPVMFQKIEEFTCDDNRFTKVRIWLMHLSENFNGSIFEKDVVDAALSTLGYIPIVAFIEENDLGEKDYSNHRYIIVKDEKGLRRKYIGSAYGVVLSNADNNAHYEDRLCDDGETRTFLVVDGVIWNSFEDSAEIINRDLIKGHSMEILDTPDAYDGYEDENGIFHFTKFSFKAACILGDAYEPAMINSTVEVQFTMNDFVESLQSELYDKLSDFTKLVKKKEQGGIKTMPNTDFTTVMQQFQDISNIVKDYEVMEDCWGNVVPRYWLEDIQGDEIIVVDRKNNYQHYGFKFTMNGDKPEIDFTNGSRKKLCYENYEEGMTIPEDSFDFGKHISEIENIAFSKVNELKSEIENVKNEKADVETNYTNLKLDYEEMKPKYEAYVVAEQKAEAEKLDAQKDAKLAEYEDILNGNADFEALKERKNELTVDELNKECAVLYVIATKSKVNFEKRSSSVQSLGVLNDGEPDNFVETKYGNIPVK